MNTQKKKRTFADYFRAKVFSPLSSDDEGAKPLNNRYKSAKSTLSERINARMAIHYHSDAEMEDDSDAKETQASIKQTVIECGNDRLDLGFPVEDLVEAASNLFSQKTWREKLTESEREKLKKDLPEGFDSEELLTKLFDKESFKFGNPIDNFMNGLLKGNFDPDLAELRQNDYLEALLDQREHYLTLYSNLKASLEKNEFPFSTYPPLHLTAEILKKEEKKSPEPKKEGTEGESSNKKKPRKFAVGKPIPRQFLYDSDGGVSFSELDPYKHLSDNSSEGTSSESSSESEAEEEVQSPEERQKLEEKKKQSQTEGNLDWIKFSPRFKNLKINKNQSTIPKAKPGWIDEYHRQEAERYRYPVHSWAYELADSSRAVVAPLCKKLLITGARARDHPVMKSDRPPYVTILSLARDAAARLPDGVGTRADLCALMKESQYIVDKVSDAELSHIISSALDRMHSENDAPVKFDVKHRLWMYLHKDRPLDDKRWTEHLKEADVVVVRKESENLTGYPGGAIQNIRCLDVEFPNPEDL